MIEPIMDTFLWYAASFLTANLVLGLVRVARGPEPADRMLAVLLFGTTGVAILLLLAEAQDRPPLRDVALVLTLLASVAGVAFVRYGDQDP